MSVLAAVLLCFVSRFVPRSFCQCVSHPRNAPSNTSMACRRFATARRTLRRLAAGLQQLVEHFDGLPQVCNSPSNTSTACRRFATAHRTLRRPVASLVSIPQLIVRVFVALSADPARGISVRSLHYVLSNSHSDPCIHCRSAIRR